MLKLTYELNNYFSCNELAKHLYGYTTTIHEANTMVKILFLLSSNGLNRSTNIDAVILMLLKEPNSITKTVNCESVANK